MGIPLLSTRLACPLLLLSLISFSPDQVLAGHRAAGSLMLSPVQARQQQNDLVSGQVKDASGQPLPGVSVFIKGTSKGTITDGEGRFTISTAGITAPVLVFTYIGFARQELVPGSRSSLEVVLQQDATSLGEVVVVGYGTQKVVNLSGAVDAVDAKVLQDRPIQTIAQGLQGTVPNLNIDFPGGEPGASPKINIRGFTSINGGEPLIVIDGVPTDPTELNFISPNDVASVSVLKDASSAAIYGARAAYGVILITTKSGKGEGVRISYSNNFSWEKPTVLPRKISDPYIYMRMLETSTDNTPWDNVNFSEEEYQWARERSDDPSLPAVRTNPRDAALWQYMGNRDWTRHLLDDFAFSQKQNLSMGGSKDHMDYLLSGSYHSQNGVLKFAEDQFDRYTVRGKMNFKPRKWFSFGNNTALSLTERVKPTHLSIQDLYNFHPTDMDVNPDGTWANSDLGREMAQLTDGGTLRDRINFFQSTFNGEVSFLERLLRLNAEFTLRRENQNFDSHQTKYKIGFGPGDVREEGSNFAYRRSAFETYSVLNLYGTFEKQLGAHYFNAVAGFNQEYSKSEWFSAQRDKVISASLPTIALATGDAQVNEGISDWAVRGTFYRLNYIFKEKYILELNGRYDGSSKFPRDKRYGFFPSASAAWRIDGENFWQPLAKTVNGFKVRASYGSLGNQFVNEYGYIASMNSRRGSYLIDGNLPQTVLAPPLVSANYSWEKVSSANLGVDLAFFEQKLTAAFDVYHRATRDMLTKGKDLPDVLGAAEPDENAADLVTKGWELALAYRNSLPVAGRELNLNTRFTLADSRSYITRYDNPAGSLVQYYKGQEIGEIWGLHNNGFFTSQQEVESLDQTAIVPWGALAVVPGWPKYQDRDGNGAIEKGLTVGDPKDLSVIGNLLPRLRFGFNLGLDYRGFDVNAFFQGVGKMDYYPLHYLYWGFYQQPYAGGYEHLLDYYRQQTEPAADRSRHSKSYLAAGLADANPDARYPVLQSWLADRNLGERIDESMGLAIPQTDYLLNAAYLRVKNLTLGYTLPEGLLKKGGINKLRFYVSGENIHEWSEVKKYFDPEALTDNVDKANPGLSAGRGWGYAYPFQRRFSFGLDLQF